MILRFSRTVNEDAEFPVKIKLGRKGWKWWGYTRTALCGAQIFTSGLLLALVIGAALSLTCLWCSGRTSSKKNEMTSLCVLDYLELYCLTYQERHSNRNEVTGFQQRRISSTVTAFNK